MIYKNKVCIDCGTEKPVSQFPRKRMSADGRHSYCLQCNNTRSVRWQNANKDRISKWRVEWRKKSPRQSLLVSLNGALKRRPCENPATIDALLAIFDKQEGRCALSGLTLTWAQGKVLPTSITLDRIGPSGDYTRDNVRLLAHAVNSFRGQMSDEEMLAMAIAIVANAKPKLRLVS